jgi:hypothetical protein
MHIREKIPKKPGTTRELFTGATLQRDTVSVRKDSKVKRFPSSGAVRYFGTIRAAFFLPVKRFSETHRQTVVIFGNKHILPNFLAMRELLMVP